MQQPAACLVPPAQGTRSQGHGNSDFTGKGIVGSRCQRLLLNLRWVFPPENHFFSRNKGFPFVRQNEADPAVTASPDFKAGVEMEFFFPRKEWNGVKISLQVAATCGAVPGWGGSQIPTVIQPLPGRGRRDLSVPVSPRRCRSLIPRHRTGIVPTLSRFMG